MPQADPKSFSGQEQHQTAQMAPNPQYFDDNTIDLYELWITLRKWKWLVIAVTVVATLGSIVYVLQLQSVYKAKALLFPPKAKDVQSISFIASGGTLSASDVFTMFKLNLKSRTLHKKFIQEKGLMELLVPDRTAETRDEDI